MNTEQNENELAKRLLDAVSSTIGLMSRIGSLFPMEEYQVMFMEPSEPGRATGKHETRTKPAFQMLNREEQRQIQEVPSVKELSSFADNFVQDQGKLLAMTFPGQDPGWTLLVRYFNETGEFKVNEDIVNEVCQAFVRDMVDPEATIVSRYLVESFESSEEFELGEGIMFRKITDEDIDSYGRGANYGWNTQTRPWLNQTHWICETECQSPKDTMEVFNAHTERLETIVGALNLSSGGRASFTLLAHYWKSPFLSTGTISGGRFVATSGTGGSAVKLDQDGIQLPVVGSACPAAIYTSWRLSICSRWADLTPAKWPAGSRSSWLKA